MIMRAGDVLVFIEVRFRADDKFGGGVASVDRQKQRRIARTAEHYLQKRNVDSSVSCRFDVVGIGAGTSDVDWVIDAFEVETWT